MYLIFVNNKMKFMISPTPNSSNLISMSADPRSFLDTNLRYFPDFDFGGFIFEWKSENVFRFAWIFSFVFVFDGGDEETLPILRVQRKPRVGPARIWGGGRKWGWVGEGGGSYENAVEGRGRAVMKIRLGWRKGGGMKLWFGWKEYTFMLTVSY